MQTACTIVAALFFVFFWLSVKVTWGTFACSVTQKPFSLLAKAVTLRVKLQSTKPIRKLHAQAAHIEVLVNVRHSFLQPLRELIRRLSSHDFQGPAAVLFANGFASNDFANVDVKTLTDDIRLSIFAAPKVLAARDTFLSPMGGS